MFFARHHKSTKGQNRTSSSRRHRAGPKRRDARFGPMLEDLENRTVLSFLAPTSYAVGSNPAGVTVGNFNGDGNADIAVVNQAAAGTVGILLGNGDGTFQPKVDYAAGADAVD